MPDLNFEIVGADASARSITPLLQFRARITNSPPEERIQAVLLNAQIQIQSAQRNYTAGEKEKLVELFGPPEAWGQTLRNRLWAHANATVAAFSGNTEAMLPVPCTYDLNVAASRYFFALEGGDVSLLFLFSGSIFYAANDGRLQISPISWNKECVYRMPAQVWRELMERHYPNTAWLSLRRDVFERLYAYKRRRSIVTWEETMERLIEERREPAVSETVSVAREEVTA
jgi:hypothetical protein